MAEMRQFCTFYLRGQYFGVDALKVQRVEQATERDGSTLEEIRGCVSEHRLDMVTDEVDRPRLTTLGPIDNPWDVVDHSPKL